MKKRAITAMILAGFFGLAQAQNSFASSGHVHSATSISRVSGDGRKEETVVSEYDTPSSKKSLTYGRKFPYGGRRGDTHLHHWPAGGLYVVHRDDAEGTGLFAVALLVAGKCNPALTGPLDWLFEQHR